MKSKKSLKAGIVGATGYAGEELIKILLRHPYTEIAFLVAKIDETKKISDIFPAFKKRLDLECGDFDIDPLVKKCDVVFLALPHTASMKIAPLFLGKGKKVVDLSADYRLKDAKEYKKWYGVEHADPVNLEKAVYGLPELYSNEIRKARLVANPGCYPTSIILGCAPLLKSGLALPDSIIADSKSGATGAGRSPSAALHFPEVNENFRAYKVFSHQHTPEIDQELSNVAGREVRVIFTPHIVPMNRGILSTIYVKLRKQGNARALRELYSDFYSNCPFVRVAVDEVIPWLSAVRNTNYCDIWMDVKGGNAIIVSCIDNLVKGASGQAVENMNLMSGFDQTEGLI